MSDDELDLATAAERLGVHYQTAYRWVRSGKLPAHLRAGRYVVDPADLGAVLERRDAPTAPPPPSPERLARAADRMARALRDGDESAARRIANELVDAGCSVADLIQEVFVPPLRAIGQAWHDGQLSIWVEHRASSIVERSLADVVPNPRGRRRGTAAVAAVSGDLHSLPTSMATAALREDQWRVHHLGADIPPEELVDFCADHAVDLVVLTVTNTDVADDAHRLADELTARGTRSIVGAPGLTLTDLLAEARRA
jgi:excisionase family DNA binding protein